MSGTEVGAAAQDASVATTGQLTLDEALVKARAAVAYHERAVAAAAEAVEARAVKRAKLEGLVEGLSDEEDAAEQSLSVEQSALAAALATLADLEGED